MEIKDIQGNILIDALVTEQAVKVDELMKQYSITLSWVSVTDEQLPLGAYIEHEGVRYSLLALYNPEQSDEATYTYKPVFEHPIMRWQHIPFFFYTYSEGKVISKELDWSLTDNPANFMKAVCDAILNETGEDWSYEISADLPASASQSFSNTDIFSALNAIAGAFETEWWFDYANKIVYLSKAAYGDAVTLEVGQNIGIPSKNQSKGGYYTRFYAFGSTRNIDQSYAGSNVNSIVNRRLTLNPEKYPNGYIDIREGLTESEILVKTLVFDNIYPRSSLTISDVKVRLMWRLDDNSEKVQIGTDSEGNPVYDQYAIWYFKIPELSFSKDMLIEGKALSVHFNSGALNGREFELTYHDTAKEVTTSDGTSIQVEVGDYEINFIEEGTYIIPAITGLVPMEGDAVTLFNIVMPEEYKVSAYEELEQEVRKEIAKQGEDRNNYTFDSNKVAFFESNPNLAVGRNVLYKNGSTTLATRVIRLETQLDYAFEQKITIGNEQIKGTTQTLKEEVVNANQSIDLLAAINENTEAFQQSLQRTQKAVLDSLAKWGDMWVLDPANGAVRTRYNVIADGTIAMKDLGDGGSGEVAQGNLDNLSNVQISNPSNGDVLTYDEANDIWVNKVVKSGLDETELKSYLTTNQYAKLSDIPSLDGYATKQWVLDKNYALASDLTALRTDFDNLNTLLNGNVGGIIDTWNEVVSFLDGYSQSDDLAAILSGMNADIANRVLIEDFEKLEGSVTEIAGYFTNGSANNALKLGGQLPSYYATADALNSVSNRVQKFEDIIDIDKNGDVYIKGTRNFYTEGGTISMFGLSEGDSGEVASVSIKFEGSDDVYSAIGGIITLPAYPSGGVADSVAWSNVTGKPTTLAGYGITDALSVNGGTITGQVYIVMDRPEIDFYKDSGNSVAIMGYRDGFGAWLYNDKSDSYLNVTDSGIGTFNGNTLLHSGNYSTYALPLSGGIMQGNIDITNHRIKLGYSVIEMGGGMLGAYNPNEPITLYWYDTTDWRQIIHEGNIGSQSVNYANSAGNANSVGGYSAANLIQGSVLCSTNITAASAGWYKIASYATTGYEPRGLVDFSIFGTGGSTTPFTVEIKCDLSWSLAQTQIIVSGYNPYRLKARLSRDSNNVYIEVYFTEAISEGLLLRVPYAAYTNGRTNNSWTWSSGALSQVSVSEYTAEAGGASGICVSNQFVGVLVGNALTATKLQTARTIWGQSFDGTGNVSGVLSDVNQVTFDANKTYGIFRGDWYSNSLTRDDLAFYAPKSIFSGNVLIGTTSGIGHSYGRLQVYESSNEWGSIIYTNNSAIMSAHIGGYGMLITSSNNNNGTYLLSVRYNDSSLIGAGLPALFVKDNGNVLIGTVSDTGHKLRVNGDVVIEGVLGIQRVDDSNSWFGIDVQDIQVRYRGYDNSDGFVYHDFFSNDNLVCRIDGVNNQVIAYGTISTQKVNLYNKTSIGTSNGYLSLCSYSNEMCISGVDNDALYINYRPSHNGVAPTSLVWCAGSADSRADFYIGNLVATGTVAMGTLSSSSDARLKDNIELLTDDESLAVLRRLRPSKWNWKSNGALSYGFIAQEVESVASCMVDRMNDEELGQKLYLQYNQLHAFEVGAIQYIDSEVETLKHRVNELENELKQYRICQ